MRRFAAGLRAHEYPDGILIDVAIEADEDGETVAAWLFDEPTGWNLKRHYGDLQLEMFSGDVGKLAELEATWLLIELRRAIFNGDSPPRLAVVR
jgi:hypothetical protein